MQLLLALLLVQAQSGQPPAAGPADDWQLVNPKAIELFESDSRLMQWALEFFDSDHDHSLSVFEADDAALQFKRIADADRDGRVTPEEFRSAREFIVARWVADGAHDIRR